MNTKVLPFDDPVSDSHEPLVSEMVMSEFGEQMAVVMLKIAEKNTTVICNCVHPLKMK